MKNLILTLATIFILLTPSMAQFASVRGFVKDAKTLHPLEGVQIIAKLDGIYKGDTYTDEKGFYDIKSLPVGKYNLTLRLLEYTELILEGIVLQADMVTDMKITYLPKQLQGSIKSVEIIRLKNPHIRQGQIASHIQGRSITNYRSTTSNANARTSGGKNTSKSVQRKTNPNVSQYKSSESPLSENKKTKNTDTTTGTEEYNSLIENPFLTAHNNLLSTFSIDVDKAAYSNMRRFLKENSLPKREVIRTEELLNYFTYNYPQPTDSSPFSIITEMADCPWNKEHKLLHIGIEGKIVSLKDIPPMNLVFLVDISGSMQEPNKLPLVVESLKMLTAQLRAQDKICIVTYAGADGIALPPTSGYDKNKIYMALDDINNAGGGGTNGSAGINRAYLEAANNFVTNGNNRVILCTDGDFNVGVSSNQELEQLIGEKRKTGIYLSVLGFGMGNYKDNRMEMLADKGNGNYAYIDKIQEATKVFVHEIGGTLYAIAKDVKIQMEFNPMFVREYRLIGYENRKLDNKDFSNDAVDAGDLGSGHNVTALYEIVPNLDKTEQGVLKYDKSDITPSKLEGNEWLFVKMRYKNPKSSVSKLIIHKVLDTMTNNPTSNFYFSVAVVEFAMLMQNSQYKGTSSFEEVTILASKYSENDLYGYKKEFVELIKIAEKLSVKNQAKN